MGLALCSNQAFQDPLQTWTLMSVKLFLNASRYVNEVFMGYFDGFRVIQLIPHLASLWLHQLFQQFVNL
jgi:hypothetical protein